MTAARLPIIAVLVGPVATASERISAPRASPVRGFRRSRCTAAVRTTSPARGSPGSPVSPAHSPDSPPAGVTASRRPPHSNPHSPRSGPRFSSIRFQRDRILSCGGSDRAGRSRRLSRLGCAALVLIGVVVSVPRPLASVGIPQGVWLIDNEVAVQVFNCSNLLCGRILWLSIPRDPQGRLVLDKKNPDPALR